MNRFAASLLLIAALGLGGPAAAQSNTPQQLQPGDVFGAPVTLPARTIIYVSGQSNWESAFPTLVEAFKTLRDYLGKQGIKPDGPPMAIYTETNDDGFKFRAALPIAETPKNPPQGDIAVGAAPDGKAVKFIHRGSYRSMDATYEAIANYLDDKSLEAKDVFIEQYAQDPAADAADKLVVEIYVPVK